MTLYVQIESMVAVLLLGLLFGAWFDTYLRFVRKHKRKRIRIFISDIFFFISYGLVFFYIVYLVNEGNLRFYLFLANLLGLSIYHVLFRKYFLNFLEFLLRFVLRLYIAIKNVLRLIFIEPIRYILKLLVLFAMIISKVILFLLRPIQLLFYHTVWKYTPQKVKKRIKEWIQSFPEKKNEWLQWLKQ